jgi:predicted transcriptional regulator
MSVFPTTKPNRRYKKYLDALDLYIIEFLRKNGKVNIATIAKGVKAPHNKVSRRLYALQDRGIVKIDTVSACSSLVELVKPSFNGQSGNEKGCQ